MYLERYEALLELGDGELTDQRRHELQQRSKARIKNRGERETAPIAFSKRSKRRDTHLLLLGQRSAGRAEVRARDRVATLHKRTHTSDAT